MNKIIEAIEILLFIYPRFNENKYGRDFSPLAKFERQVLSMGKLYLITTSSGSIHRVWDIDKKWLERTPSPEANILRKDGERIKIYEILQLTLGKPAIFALEPLGLGNLTVRETSEIVEIKIIDEIWKEWK